VTQTPLDGAYCNTLMLAHWSFRQERNNQTMSVQFSSVTSLCMRLCAARCLQFRVSIGFNTIYTLYYASVAKHNTHGRDRRRVLPASTCYIQTWDISSHVWV